MADLVIRVLLVEDDPKYLDLVKEIFQEIRFWMNMTNMVLMR